METKVQTKFGDPPSDNSYKWKDSAKGKCSLCQKVQSKEEVYKITDEMSMDIRKALSLGGMEDEMDKFEDCFKLQYFCVSCFQTVLHLHSCYLTFQDVKRKFEETALRVRCVGSVARDKDPSETVRVKMETLDDHDIESRESDPDYEDDLQDEHDEEEEEEVAHSKRISNRKKNSSEGKTKKKIKRQGGLTEVEYRKKRRAQSAGYYQKKKTLIDPKFLAAHPQTGRSVKIHLDSNNFRGRSNGGPRISVVKLKENRFSFRNIEFTVEDGVHHCDKCGHTAKSLNTMRVHIAKAHFEPESGYKCSFCGKTYYYKCHLDEHLASHTDKGANIQCEECGASFKYKSGYFTHLRVVHRGIKPHKCDHCEKSFGGKKDLRRHMVTHNKFREKPHVCQFCGISFIHAVSLKAHENRKKCKPMKTCKSDDDDKETTLEN